MTARAWRCAALLAGALIVISAFILRAPAMNNHFFQAEFLYLHGALASQDFKDFNQALSGQMQPFGEYVLRKMLWFPLLGYSERSMRLPGLIYSLALICFGMGFTFWYFRSRERQKPLTALLLSVLCASCYAASSEQTSLVGMGRHYSFIWLVATLWSAYFVFARSPRVARFAAASFAFMNTHLFSLSIITTAFGWLGLAVDQQPQQRRGNAYLRRILAWAAAYGLILSLSIYFNSHAYYTLSHEAPPDRPLTEALREACRHFFDFLVLLGFPKFGYFIWLLVALQWRRVEARRLLLLLLGPLPVFLVMSRLRSHLPFASHYLSAFGGLWLPALVLALSEASRIWQNRLRPWFGTAHIRLAAVSGLWILGAYLFGTTDLIYKAATIKIPRLSPNFSDTFQTFNEIRALAKPLFVIDPCDSAERALYYLRFNGNNPYPFGYHVVDLGCFVEPRQVVALFEHFVEVHPKGLIVLYSDSQACAYREFTIERPLGRKIKVHKTHVDTTCVWIADGVRGWSDLEALTRSVAWPDEAHFFKRIHSENLVK